MKIAFLGDISFNNSFDIVENPSLKDGLKDIANYLSKFDLVIGNLESPFTREWKMGPAKSAYLGAHPENADLLKMLNVGVCNLANNHIMDYGEEGLMTTIEVLEKSGIKYFGHSSDSLKLNIDSNLLSLNGYCCYSSNPGYYPNASSVGCNEFDISSIERMIEEESANNALPIIAVHAGIEHVQSPAIDNIIVSRRFAEKCPYIYYGHHPHVLQGVENYKDSLIAHSLGNFIFGENDRVSLSEDNRNSAILEVTIEENRIKDFKLTPIYIGKGVISVFPEKLSSFQNRSEEFNQALQSPEAYSQKRMEVRNAWIANRKSSRNLKWYLKRLTPRYARLFMSNRRNAKLYSQHVKSQL